MSRIKNAGASFVLFTALLCASTGIASGRTTSAQQQMRVAQESAVVGGSPGCAFADGVAVGLGVGALFGCVPCGVGAVVIGLGSLYYCHS
jgi:hypothetical protein